MSAMPQMSLRHLSDEELLSRVGDIKHELIEELVRRLEVCLDQGNALDRKLLISHFADECPECGTWLEHTVDYDDHYFYFGLKKI